MPATHSPQRRHTFRPALEALETRDTPSTLSTLVSFNGTNGENPEDALIMDGSGNLYGTTDNGGASGEYGGTVFELAPGSGTLTTLANLDSASGYWTSDGLVMDSSGNLYGETFGGGASDSGTVFELARGSGTPTALASIPDGYYGNVHAFVGLVIDSSGNLYGTTFTGGVDGDGIVFELAKGSGTLTTLATFNGTNGRGPEGLLMDNSGNLYGTTFNEGASGDGTVFELAAGSGTITTLATFNGTNGNRPSGSLIADSSGNLYGTTRELVPSQDGTVFELAAGSGTITTLASFDGANGESPEAGLIMDSSGNLYGTTSEGGASGDGTAFELADGTGTITTLASFDGNDGSYPDGALIMDSSGNLYGTTADGGASNDGTVFKITNGPSFAITGPTTVTAGSSGTFTLTALNANGTADTGYSGTVQFTSSDSKAILPGNVTVTNGTGTFNATLETAGTQTITATDVNNPGMTGVDTVVVVSPAAASQVIFTVEPSSGAAGKTLGTVQTTLEDAYGNVETGDKTDTVTLNVSTGPSTQMGGTLTETVAAGVATFSNLVLNTSGNYSLAAVANLAGGGALGPVVSSSFTVASPVSLSFGSITYNSRTGLYSETVTLTNITSGTLTGPMSLELTNLPSGVTLTDATGITNGNPYYRFLSSGKTLKKAASVSITLTFTAPSASDITFGTEVVVGL